MELSGQGPQAKLIDFGLSSVLPAREGPQMRERGAGAWWEGVLRGAGRRAVERGGAGGGMQCIGWLWRRSTFETASIVQATFLDNTERRAISAYTRAAHG